MTFTKEIIKEHVSNENEKQTSVSYGEQKHICDIQKISKEPFKMAYKYYYSNMKHQTTYSNKLSKKGNNIN